MNTLSLTFLRYLGLSLASAGLLYGLYLARDVLYGIFAAGVIVLLLSPILDALERKMSSTLAVTVTTVGLIVIGVILIGSLLPLLIGKIGELAEILFRFGESLRANPQELSNIISRFTEPLVSFGLPATSADMFSVVQTHLGTLLSSVGWFLSTGVTSFFGSIFGAFFAIQEMILIGVFAVFFAIERKTITPKLISFLPLSIQGALSRDWTTVKKIVGGWIRGQIILSSCIFWATLFGLTLIQWIFGVQIDGIFSLAIIAAVTEFIPVIGPLIALLPALVVAVEHGPLLVFAIVVLYIVIQQFENLYLVPKVQGQLLELSSFEILVWMSIFGALFGIPGVIVALPIVAVLKYIFRGYISPEKWPKPPKKRIKSS